MSKRLLRFVTAGAAAALLLVPATGTAAQAAPDRTPGVTDNVTPEPRIRYETFANGRFIGLLDRGSASTAWGDLRLRDEGRNRVHVEAVDAAGNRSRSSTSTVTGFDCEV